jgi:hypothetical protein
MCFTSIKALVINTQLNTIMFSGKKFPILIAAVLTLSNAAITDAIPQAPTKTAMTWVVKKVQPIGGKTYVLFGSDSSTSTPTNPYVGDTLNTEKRSLLCLKIDQNLYPQPVGLNPPASVTPGGANVNTWSYGKVMVIPNVQGNTLVSKADADNKCNQVGTLVHGISGFRMAEFHDGSGPNTGWGFWAEGYDSVEGLDAEPQTLSFSNARYWVCINDQNANTWQGFCKNRRRSNPLQDSPN